VYLAILADMMVVRALRPWFTNLGKRLVKSPEVYAIDSGLLIVRGDRRLGFEFERSETPSATKSMHAAMQDLQLERLDVVHLGPDTFPLRDRIRALSIQQSTMDLKLLA